MKSNFSSKLSILAFTIIIVLNSCQSKYTKLVKNEMKSGVVHDTIIFDLKFGDTKTTFFKRCWDLNKQKLVSQGPNNNYVQYLLPDKKDSTTRVNDINMLFYAKFDSKNKIEAMDFKFNYVSWAPWNEKQYATALLPIVTDTLMKWYPGNDFLEITKKDNQKMLVKVDGNRQITLYPDANTRDVSVLIEDLRIKIANKKE
tara:strand:- start:79493 stop:80092 length:600 start_codon:yes stop_codon:yes gene_type:complete